MFAEAATAALSRRVADLERRLAAIERPVGLGGTTIYEGPIL